MSGSACTRGRRTTRRTRARPADALPGHQGVMPEETVPALPSCSSAPFRSRWRTLALCACRLSRASNQGKEHPLTASCCGHGDSMGRTRTVRKEPGCTKTHHLKRSPPVGAPGFVAVTSVGEAHGRTRDLLNPMPIRCAGRRLLALSYAGLRLRDAGQQQPEAVGAVTDAVWRHSFLLKG